MRILSVYVVECIVEWRNLFQKIHEFNNSSSSVKKSKKHQNLITAASNQMHMLPFITKDGQNYLLKMRYDT